MPHPAFLPAAPLLPRHAAPLRAAACRPRMTLLSDVSARARADTRLLLAASSRVLSVAAVVAALSLPLDGASAAGAGGRVGGSSFRSPRMSRPAPRAPARSPSYGGGYGYSYGYGGGYSMPGLFLNPFIMPIGGFGMGGFGSLLLFATAGAFLYESFAARKADQELGEQADPKTAVAVLKVGLLANARPLQLDLDAMARSADTASPAGLRYVLQQTATALLRNPDYWMYAAVDVRQARLSDAESQFTQLALEERLKLGEETLSNADGRRTEAPRARAGETDVTKAPSEYIVVALLVAAAGDLVTKLPKVVDGTKDVDRALRALAAVSKDQVQAVEVVWAPQSLKDTLSQQEMLMDHPELRRL